MSQLILYVSFVKLAPEVIKIANWLFTLVNELQAIPKGNRYMPVIKRNTNA